MKKRKQKAEEDKDYIVVRQEGDLQFVEMHMSKRLRKKMAALAEKTAGTLQAI